MSISNKIDGDNKKLEKVSHFIMDLPYDKEIFDPIHGFIKLTHNEVNIIDSLIFQRLHNINQLGTLHMVFPTARNTRFSHSLGVLAITSQIIENLKYLPESDSKVIRKIDFLDDEYKCLIRASALLHDIGHVPFSHCTEKVIRNYLNRKYPKLEIRKKFHEWLGGEIIKKTGIYSPKNVSDANILNEHRESIGQIINGTSNMVLFNQMLHSELDADRLDYLVRDSYSTGVSFGQVDIEQILRKMFIKKRDFKGELFSDNIIVYSTKAINAIDNYYFARMFMYNTVYYHKVASYFDYLLSESYKIMLESKNIDLIDDFIPIKPDIILDPLIQKENLSKEEIQEFYINWHKFDDHYLWNCMRNSWHILRKKNNSRLNSDLKNLKLFLSLLFRRKKSFLIWEKNRLKTNKESTKTEKRFENEGFLKEILQELEDWIKTELNEEYKLPIIVLNHEVEAPLKNFEMDDPKDPKLLDYVEEYTLFYEPDTDEFHYLHNVQSSINYRTNKAEFYIFRVFYPNGELKDELNHIVKKKYKELIESRIKESDDN